MTKRIRAIKCPHCGSVDKQDVKDDHYLCRNCGTEYYLDRGDINIHHRYHGPPTETATSVNKKAQRAVLIIGAVVFAFIILANVIASLLSGPSSTTGSGPASTSYYWYSRQLHFLEDGAQKPVFLLVGSQRPRGGATDEGRVMAVFFDAVSQDMLSQQELPVKPGSIRTQFRRFDSGELWFIIDDKHLFRVDDIDKSVREITPGDYPDIPEIQPGLAKVEFAYSENGDGLRIVTNEGRQLHFYPAIGQVYSQDEYYKARRGFDTIPQDSPVRTGFKFSSRDSNFPDERIQLIKYQHRSPVGHPKTAPSFGWRTVHNMRTHQREKIFAGGLEAGRTLSYEDLTPGRLYFKPRVLDYNDQYVLISFAPTPADDETLSLQLLDASTGDIVWTYLSEERHVSEGLITTSGCFARDLFIGLDGELVRKFELSNH